MPRGAAGYYDRVMIAPLAEPRRAYSEALDRSLKTAVQGHPLFPEVEKVVLFGSYGRGRRDLLPILICWW